MSAADDEDRFASYRLTDEEARVANSDIQRRSGVRVLPDDGVALRELLGKSLVGKRMLIPSPFVTPQGLPAIRAITNTRS